MGRLKGAELEGGEADLRPGCRQRLKGGGVRGWRG